MAHANLTERLIAGGVDMFLEYYTPGRVEP